MTRYLFTGALLITVALNAFYAEAQTIEAGTPVVITYTARDTSGNVITDWNTVGAPCTVTLDNSTANTDTSQQTWSADPDGYTWAMLYHEGTPLPQTGPHEWTLSNTLFVAGIVEITLVDTKAEYKNVSLEISCPEVSADDTLDIDYTAGPIANFLVEITWPGAQPGYVYLLRKYEIVVSPRDKYLNYSNKQVRTRFSARFRYEFLHEPGYSDIFSGDVFITGVTIYFLASTVARIYGTDTLQWISASAYDEPSINGQSVDYEIRNHPPGPFTLESPPDPSRIEWSDPQLQHNFRWGLAHDPYTNIQISRFTNEIGNDDVKYSLTFLDSLTLTKSVTFEADSSSYKNQLTLKEEQLTDVWSQLIAPIPWGCVIWVVDATDDLYTTRNDPSDAGLIGFRLFLRDPSVGVERIANASAGFALHACYPNPVQNYATISFDIEKQCHATLRVYNQLGEQVASLADEGFSPGRYRSSFNTTGLPSGVYHYTLTAGRQSVTKTMVVQR
jgi:Secretion system C-terminal sorting domain